MPFDLSSAQPADQGSAGTGGFDLASAQPVVQPAAQAPAAPSIGQQLARQAGLGARAGIEGVTAIPQIITNAGIGAYNLGAQGINKLAGTNIPPMRSSTAALEDAMTRLGLPQPNSTSERAANVGMQMLSGGAAESATRPIETLMGGAAPSAQISPAAQEARAAGYRVPPTQLRDTTANRYIEGLSGRDQMARAASVRNQAVTNQLAARAIGLPENRQLTTAAIDEVIRQQGQAYNSVKALTQPIRADLQYLNEISNLGRQSRALAQQFPRTSGSREVENLIDDLSQFSFRPDAAIDKIKELRFEANANFKNAADPARLSLARAQSQAADALDGIVERNLRSSGNAQLYRDYVAARTRIARAYTVRRALDDASGNVSAQALGKEIAKDRPLTDELRTIGRVGNAFPQATRSAQRIGSQPGVSPLDLWASMLELSHGIPGAALTALGVRPALRGFALSNAGQNLAANGVSPAALSTLLGTGAPLVNQGK
ncbi:hypothetical protein AB4Y36_01490 [Paraburkholderia sp. BR10936]|uniref:hypothetical protein n=1 Tax=Paraburkholderia sp. BR10936 TaxID=3236993 RepID=UPI0034D2914E